MLGSLGSEKQVLHHSSPEGCLVRRISGPVVVGVLRLRGFVPIVVHNPALAGLAFNRPTRNRVGGERARSSVGRQT